MSRSQPDVRDKVILSSMDLAVQGPIQVLSCTAEKVSNGNGDFSLSVISLTLSLLVCTVSWQNISTYVEFNCSRRED